MKLIPRLIFTRQLRTVTLWIVLAIVVAYIYNLCALSVFGLNSGIALGDRYFNVLMTTPYSAGYSDPSTIVSSTSLGLSNAIPFVSVGMFISIVGENARAWLGAGLERRTIFIAYQTFIALTTVVMTSVTTLIVGFASFMGSAIVNGLSLFTVLYTFLLYLGILELVLLGCTIFLRFPLWLAIAIVLGVPFASAFLIGNVASGVLHISIDLDLSNNTPLLTVVVLGISLVMALLSWAFLASLPMRRG
ncbi:hypothetical protein [Arcanobacterium phocae]|uniref:hypothetical protein n=1 Tax=Arcanobacterium phocae TaxID=131112 RepID=UPI001C0FE9F7|nr:hypothetical protein [Arcanobacterium phocae]